MRRGAVLFAWLLLVPALAAEPLVTLFQDAPAAAKTRRDSSPPSVR